MVVAFSHDSILKPLLDVVIRPNQVVVRFIPYGQEHFTLHRESDVIINTHHSDNKPVSVWDDLRVETASHMGLQHPERHRGYIKHSPLVKIDNVNGFYLLGRRFDLNEFVPNQRYYRNIRHTVITPFNPFMLKFYLSTVDNPCSVNLPRFGTTLGDLCFEFES
jgi:hypothetical protein